MLRQGDVERDVLRRYLDTTGSRVRHLGTCLTRTKSRTGREVLARATVPETTAAELEADAVAYLEGSGPTADRVAFAHAMQLPGALEYASVVAAQNVAATDHRVARGLLAAGVDVHGEEALTRRETVLRLQLALEARDFALAERVLTTRKLPEPVRKNAAVDVVNPWLRPGLEESAWLARLNAEIYDGLQPVTLRPDGPTPFDRLASGAGRAVRHEQRITVIMSCYNPGQHLLTAVRSVLEQTWQNLELLVVDDASPSPAAGVLEAAEASDSRVRVIRKKVNGGTYRARNTALTQATGDFFTCVDSDDWAHPQRLELGVRPMLADPGLLATRGFGLRGSTDLQLSRSGRRAHIVASSSLMVRTFPGLNRMGFFDPVRKGADNEYALRLEAAFGGFVHDLAPHPLTVLLADDASLSAADFSPGWRHPARSEYSESPRHFHAEVAARRRPAFLDPSAPRLFPAPRRWQRLPQDGEPGPVLDLCVVADWREGNLDEATVDEVARAAAGGAVVGVVHLESLHDLRPDAAPVASALRELIAAGTVERVYLDDDREARHVVVADPRPFQFPGVVDVRLRTGRVDVRPLPGAQMDGHYASETVAGHLTDAFGVPPAWAPVPQQT